MTVPVFEEYEPALDCPCPGCAERRRELARGLPVRSGGHPAAHGARRALVLVTAAGVALGATGAGVSHARADTGAGTAAASNDRAPDSGDTDPTTPQGGSGPLYGRPSTGPSAPASAPLRTTTRADIINRAKRWVGAKVPYSMNKYWSDGYRQDCSGFVSMAWNLAGNEWTGSLAKYGVKIARADLEPGDMLLFHNLASPNKGSHVTIFGGWADFTHSYYLAYEQSQPLARKLATPLAYWSNSSRYVAYRYKGLSAVAGGSAAKAAAVGFPGAKSFGPGANNKYVTQLGEMLVARGGKRFYSAGPGPRWDEADRRATRAFQLAQGWRGAQADGLPGSQTWRYLVNHQGKGIAGAGSATGAAKPRGTRTDAAPVGTAAVTAAFTAEAPSYPGKGSFRPGRAGAYVERLGRQLVRKGFGAHYTSGPGPRWSEADRRNVEAFQRAQGWRGMEADGYPGPETWRRLFA